MSKDVKKIEVDEVKVEEEGGDVWVEEVKPIAVDESVVVDGLNLEAKKEVELENRNQEGCDVEHKADVEEYEDVMELPESVVKCDDKGETVVVNGEKEFKENAGITEGGGDVEVSADNEFVEEEEEGGYEGVVVLGQEMQVEISDMAKRRKLRKEQEIFVGGLDRDAVEEDVKKVFETVGEVLEVKLHKDFVTNKNNKGFAFVTFANKEYASKALAEFKNPVIQGKRCGTAPREDNETLFLGNICNTWTKESIKRKLREYGVEGVENIILVEETQNKGLTRGFFIEFSCHADATLAYKRLRKADAIFRHPERSAKVAFAEPLREPDAEVMA